MNTVKSPSGFRIEATNCRSCIAGCGLLVHLEDNQVLKIAGDKNHPQSRGYSCSKGRGVAMMHHAANRLSFPVIKGRRTSWSACLDDIANRIRQQRDSEGPDKVAAYRGTGLFTDSLGWWCQARFLERLGSRQNYSSTTVDVAPLFKANELVTGFAWLFPSWIPELPDPNLILMFGLNPSVSHGAMGSVLSNPTQRIRDFRNRGGQLWVIDPRQTKTAMLADRHLAPRPNSDVMILGWLVRELLQEGYDASELTLACHAEDVTRLKSAVEMFELDRVVEMSGVSASDLQELRDAIRRNGKVGILPGTGISFGDQGVLAGWLSLALMIITGSLDRKGGMPFIRNPLAPPATVWTGHAAEDGTGAPGPDSRPDLSSYFGEPPSVAIVDEIEAGHIRSLFVAGGNPLTALPDPDRVRSALSKLEMLVVIDPFESELSALATHALPAAWQLERADLQWHDRLQYTDAVMPPQMDRRPLWWIYGQIASRLELDMFGSVDIDTCTEQDIINLFGEHVYGGIEQIRSRGTHGLDTSIDYGWIHRDVLLDGKWRLAPPVVVERLSGIWENHTGSPQMINGRLPDRNNSVSYVPNTGKSASDPIHVGREVAETLGIKNQDYVRVASSSGFVQGHVLIDPKIVGRVVWINHGWTNQNVGALTDGRRVDPLTGQPIMSGFSVEITRLPSPSS